MFETDYLLWAEAKQGVKHDITESFIQLILTIGKARTIEKYLPPKFLGAFDQEKIAFVEFCEIMDVFFQNDFNWNVTPSDHTTKEFKQLKELLSDKVNKKIIKFNFNDEKALKTFIKKNFRVDSSKVKQLPVTINNFTHIYQKWCKEVRDTIAIDWEEAQKAGLIDADFFLADLLSKDNATLKDKLYVLLRGNTYQFDRKVNFMGIHTTSSVDFNDSQKGHIQFWNRYKRPPRKAFWDKMVERRDLLVPQDVRERKGSFFTPPQWVELSQEYLARELGENWQEEYYIWDCCAGTGNLLAGLTNKYHIYASTLDKADVDVMKDRIHTMENASRGEHCGSNLLESHVFQFDFLNDLFSLDNPSESKLPNSLVEILTNEEKRRKLVIYINPPYKEAPKYGTEGQKNVQKSKVNENYNYILRQGNRELYAQFFARIYKEIPSCILAEFSTLKILQGPHFVDFRKFFLAKLKRMFVVPANTFDNVKGNFPIGFMIWDTNIREEFSYAFADVYDKYAQFLQQKKFCAYDSNHYMNEWVKQYRGRKTDQIIGKFPFKGNDFQNQNMLQIVHNDMPYNTAAGQFLITKENLLVACVYFACRKVIPASWLNDRDQFLYPNEKWINDLEFQGDCLIYTLFTNNIRCQYGINHWIPFTEEEVHAKDIFKSHFMSNFIQGKNLTDGMLWKEEKALLKKSFSAIAKCVFEAGKNLWRYYQEQPNSQVDAALYDIRLFFQGIDEKGKMNITSKDDKYLELNTTLRSNLKLLAKKIEPKVYEYGFLIQ